MIILSRNTFVRTTVRKLSEMGFRDYIILLLIKDIASVRVPKGNDGTF